MLKIPIQLLSFNEQSFFTFQRVVFCKFKMILLSQQYFIWVPRASKIQRSNIFDIDLHQYSLILCYLQRKKNQRLKFQNQRQSFQRHQSLNQLQFDIVQTILMKFLGLATFGALALSSVNTEVISVSQSNLKPSLGNLKPQEISNPQSASILRSIDSNSGQFLEQLLRNMEQKGIQASLNALKNSWDSYLNPLYQDPYYKSIIQEMKLRDSLGGLKMITDQISPYI